MASVIKGDIYVWIRRKIENYYITNTNIQYINTAINELVKNHVEYRIATYKDIWKPRQNPHKWERPN